VGLVVKFKRDSSILALCSHLNFLSMLKSIRNFFWKPEKKNNTMAFLSYEPTMEQIRPKTKILFVDDEKFAVVDNLINHGWTQTKRVKDIENINHPDIQSSDIFFVDI